MNPHHIFDSGPVRFSRLFFTSIFFIFVLVNVERFARKETHSHTHTTHNTTQHKTHSQTYSHTQSIPLPDHVYPASDAVTPVKFPECKQEGGDHCNILVVVDMQNDYCKGCGSPTESKWASATVKELAATQGPINQVIQKAHDAGVPFDMILFTQDWLGDGSPFLTHDTKGAEVIETILNQDDEKSATYTKRADDWMNDGYYNGRLYAIRGEAKKGDSKPRDLGRILREFGYSPSWTSLYVTGTATYRCVMKGSVHARAHGYKVQYVKNAVEGDGDDYDWKRYACPNFMNSGVKKSCHDMFGQTCDGRAKSKWLESVYKTLGGPSVHLREHIMKNAGVLECADADAVVSSLKGTDCPLTEVTGELQDPDCS